jgi:acyl-ACP thioesterase
VNENMANVKEFEREVRIATYEVSAQSILKLSVMLRICQETSEQHLASLGIGYERLKADGLVFLITRTAVKINRMPLHGETVVVKTHPCGVVGAQFYRDFIFYSNGDKIIEVMQASVAAETATHKIMHPKKFMKYGIDPSPNGITEVRLGKIDIPHDMPLQGKREIRFSDLDYNSHLNNAVYGDIICDYLPGGIMGRQFSEIQINYVNESKLGETLEVYAQEQDGTVSMYANNERGRGFECTAVLVPK